MRILINIPTYKREHLLNRVLTSIETSIQEAKKNIPDLVVNVIISNNDVSTKIKKSEHNDWIEIKNRTVAVSPNENWYSVLLENENKYDAYTIIGDDDFVESDYVKEILHLTANIKDEAIYIRGYRKELFISENCEFLKKEKTDGGIGKEWVYEKLDDSYSVYTPAFISSHLYTDINKLKKIRKYIRCVGGRIFDGSSIPYLLMEPEMIFIAALGLYGKIAVSPNLKVLRGVQIREKIDEPYGIRSWNSGFLMAIYALFTMHKEFDLIDGIESHRVRCANQALCWFFPCLFDRRLKKRDVLFVYRKLGLFKVLNLKLLIMTIRLVLSEKIGIRKRRFVKELKGLEKSSFPEKDFVLIEKIYIN